MMDGQYQVHPNTVHGSVTPAKSPNPVFLTSDGRDGVDLGGGISNSTSGGGIDGLDELCWFN